MLPTMSWRPWHLAWHDALYGERGFYRAAAGPAAHFATSVQGIPSASSAMAQAVSGLADAYGLNRIVDLGCGRGELLTAIGAARTDLELIGVDVVGRPDGLPDRIGWWRSPGGARIAHELADLRDTLVFAHEWLDDVPCVIAQLDDAGAAREIEVNDDGDQRAGAPVAAPDEQWLRRHWPDPPLRTLDIGRARDDAWLDLCSRVTDGVVVAVDYGHLRSTRPAGSTLIGYRQGATCAPVPDGSANLTAHVAMDSLAGATLRTQREVLQPLKPAAPPYELARSAPADYLHALAARSGWDALTMPGGLGDFWWALADLRTCQPKN